MSPQSDDYVVLGAPASGPIEIVLPGDRRVIVDRAVDASARHNQPFAGLDPPAALFRYSRHRSGDHPVEHLRTHSGGLLLGYREPECRRSEGPKRSGMVWRLLPRDSQ